MTIQNLLRPLVRTVATATLLLSSVPAQVAMLDSQGREWRQLVGTTNQTWDEIAAVCPTDGLTPASGTIGGLNVDGWIWATRAQVTELFGETVPQIATTPTLAGSAYVLQAMSFFTPFTPTFQYYTTFGGYQHAAGWTATGSAGSADVAAVSAQWPVFYGEFSVEGAAATTSRSQYRGIWLWRQSAYSNLRGSLPGTNGAAVLRGTRGLVANGDVALQVYNGLPNAPGLLVFGFSRIDAPLFGGTLLPSPDVAVAAPNMNSGGTFDFVFPLTGVGTGTQIFVQNWFLDVGAPQGIAASNGLRIQAP